MKVKLKRTISFVVALALVFSFSVSAFAVESRASDQIFAFSMGATSKLSKVIVSTYIVGTNTMNKIGTESIYVWKQVSDGWLLIYDLKEDEDYEEEHMFDEDTIGFGEDYYFDSVAGVNYRVDVTLFAEDDRGRDTVSGTYYVTGKSGVSR